MKLCFIKYVKCVCVCFCCHIPTEIFVQSLCIQIIKCSVCVGVCRFSRTLCDSSIQSTKSPHWYMYKLMFRCILIYKTRIWGITQIHYRQSNSNDLSITFWMFNEWCAACICEKSQHKNTFQWIQWWSVQSKSHC